MYIDLALRSPARPRVDSSICIATIHPLLSPRKEKKTTSNEHTSPTHHRRPAHPSPLRSPAPIARSDLALCIHSLSLSHPLICPHQDSLFRIALPPPCSLQAKFLSTPSGNTIAPSPVYRRPCWVYGSTCGSTRAEELPTVSYLLPAFLRRRPNREISSHFGRNQKCEPEKKIYGLRSGTRLRVAEGRTGRTREAEGGWMG